MKFRAHQGLLHLNFLYGKEEPSIQLELVTMAKEWDNWMKIVRKVYHLISTFLMQTNSKRRKIIGLYKNKELNCDIGKVPLPTFDGSSQSSANTWVQKLDVYF